MKRLKLVLKDYISMIPVSTSTKVASLIRVNALQRPMCGQLKRPRGTPQRL